ncbi:MAG: amidohydrolase [Acidobacteria bacterium]|nr:amidohydrolase [Acidobacteriota bacterium]
MLLMLMFSIWAQGTVYTNAVAYTLDPQSPQVRHFAVENGKFVWLGQDLSELGPMAEWPRIDLAGKTVLPGLIDAHAHLLGLGNTLFEVDLVGTASYQEVIDRVRQFADKVPTGQWVVGRGWDQNDWVQKDFPDHQALSKAIPDHPVYLTRVDGHAALVNTMAMVRAGLTAETPDPPGGKLLRADGKLTGVLIDLATDLVALPQLDSAQIEARLLAAAQLANRNGLTGIHDAGVSAKELRAYEALAQKGDLSLRIYAMLSQNPETLKEEMPKGLRLNAFDGFLTVRSIKCYMDGALGSRGAWLKKPYSDDPHQHGLQLTPGPAMDALLDRALQAGFQVNTHAIGDQANAFTLEAYHRALAKLGSPKDRRLRIEHAQVLDPADFHYFVEDGIVPSMQPTHCTSDMPWAPDRLGSDRIKGAYAWRSLRELGLKIPMGSDFPVEGVSPWDGLYAAITTQDKQGHPPNGYRPDQKLKREEALLGFTLWAAYGAFQEDQLGSLEVGKFADFVVIDRDYFTCPVAQIPQIQVLRTVVHGQQRYVRE